mmetsp:Transcript_21754/g.39235  ORF Transcript_21754/g.39235 Transcript_21754/m.39235 type:complete len:465 (-) Transcript_21754:216-1610(-)|eukprot:CAMPEP_0201894480 /NCGR_PEP_ID=MMETSP0902-20130614/40791_1 /ASSEMBLY_ACC=CAM_ASM_000551 /TAXON_ID=420261 /ORGANISM="Thalassiosira antarctica, Strain CCMP982" /LENGTH=464 /DNA_ID=CAMNT_0048426535 /DNA_START=203 /DNA_END=1597 /DNA_ORIENTATION=+
MSDPNRNTKKEHDKLQRYHQQSPAAARSSSTGERSAPARIAEQQPVMRSVAISPASHQQRTLHSEPVLRRVNPGGLAQLRPLRGVSQQSELVSVKAPPKHQLLQHRSKSESSLVRKWHVEHASLPSRPDDFPPLRTTRVVFSAPADVISNRISDCLQSRSIKTKFSKTDGNVAKCRNTDFCKFTIRLYAGDEGGVLVEVQRLYGDCVSFMKDCRAVFNASEGKTEESHPSDDKPMYLRLPVSEMAFLRTASLPPVSQEEEADCVNVTADLLSSHQSDTNMLGMESLVIQTDPLKTLKSTAIMASRMILCPDDPRNISFNMHNYVMSLLIYGHEDYPSAPEDSALEDHSTKTRNLAMSALSNALSLFASEKLLLTTISSNHEWYTSVLIPKLLQDLSTAAHHPHDACYASRCLSTLAESSVEFACTMKEAGGHDAVRNAEEVGVREFALLARDAGSCHQIMRCCV